MPTRRTALGDSVRHDTTSDDPLPVTRVEDSRLPRCDAHHRLREPRHPLAALTLLDSARHRGAVVANLHRAGLVGPQEPVHPSNPHLAHLQVLLFPNDDLPRTGAHLRHVEGCRRRDAYTTPLADGKVHHTRVAPEHPALPVHDGAGLCGYALADEPAVISVWDKADVLALRGVGDGEAALLGDAAHLRLAVLT